MVLALAVVPLFVEAACVSCAGPIEIRIVLDVHEDVISAGVWRHKSEALVLEEAEKAQYG